MDCYLATREQCSRVLLLSKLTCGLLVCTALTPVAALAQQAGASGGDTQVQEIVVTAQRRQENLQDTPVAVSAFNAEALKATGVTTIKDLGQDVPSLQVANTAGAYFPFLRGIGNNAAGSVGNESSVATYIDDVYYTHLSAAYLTLGDVDRVEVLNGPQGTLFGRNSSGGAIQMFTKDPGAKPELDATAGYANYETFSGQLYLSTPITDTLGWNLAVGGSNQQQGWGHSITTGQPAELGDSVTVRSKLVWQATDRTRIKIVGFYAHSASDIGSVDTNYMGTYGLTPALAAPGYPNPPMVQPSLGNNPATFYDTRLNAQDIATEDGYGGSLRIDQDLGFADLVSISAFRNSRGNYHLDLDYSPEPFVNADLHDFDDQITQEFQLKSKSSSKISWILGAYYLHASDSYDPVFVSGDVLNVGVAPGTTASTYSKQTINSYSGYGQATAPIGYQTNLTLGVRLTEDEVSGVGSQYLTIPGVGTVDGAPAGVPNPYTNSRDTGAFTYRAALDHHFTDNLMAYASVSRGYKSGAFNMIPIELPPAQPEIVQAYEVGFKSELFDRRLRLNSALFWNDIKDPQVLSTVTTGILSSVSLTNAQRARSRGAEVGFDAVAAPGFRLRGGVTYLDARYTQFDNAPIFSGALTPGSNLTGPVLGNGNGNQLANVPKWRATGGANYTLNTNIGEWVGDVGVSYTDRFPWTADNHLWEKAVTLVNASLSFTPAAQDRMTVTLWGKNLGNVKYYLIGQETVGGAGTGGFVGAPAAPLTVGGTVSVKFF